MQIFIVIGMVVVFVLVVLYLVSVAFFWDCGEAHNTLPKSLNLTQMPWFKGPNEVPYTVFAMSFERWKELFELSPDSFLFITRSGVPLSNQRITEYSYCRTHPCYFDKESGEFYLVKFSSADYKKYYNYDSEIIQVLSSLPMRKISLAIVGDIRAKIEKIAEEARLDIKDTLKLQEEIVLRLSEEQKKN